MLSRVAENVYWMARYIERAENTARIVSVNDNLLLDLPRSTSFGWEPLLFITGSEEVFFQRYRQPDEFSVVGFLLGDPGNPSSIVSCLSFARENLRTTRDIAPRESWEAINDLYLYAKDNLERGISRQGRYNFLKVIIRGAQQIAGLLSGTMSHTHAYDFVLLGRLLERADMTTRILDVRSANLLPQHADELTPFENIQWMSVLKSLSAYQMYRQQVRLRVRGRDVFKFLLQDALFPRTVCYCLNNIQDCLNKLPKNTASLDSVSQLKTKVTQAQISELVNHSVRQSNHQQQTGINQSQTQSSWAGELANYGLHEFIDELQIGLAHIHDQIRSTYFPTPLAGLPDAGGN